MGGPREEAVHYVKCMLDYQGQKDYFRYLNMRFLSLQSVLRKSPRTLLPYFHEQPFIPLCQILLANLEIFSLGQERCLG
jgi:hypothetical protein